MNHRIFILGSSEEFIQLVKVSKARGICTIVCDGNPDGPAKKEADIVYDVDVRSTEKIAEICRKERVDGILTAFSDLLLECMVKIAAKAGLPCYLIPEQLKFYRDKSVMKKMFASLDIPTPRYVETGADCSPDLLGDLRFPVVTKPLDRYGSRGVLVLNSLEEIRSRFHEICAGSETEKILLEEYNTGYEFNLMAWVNNGQVFVLGIADREKSPGETHSIPVCSRNVYPSCLMDHVYQDAKRILEKVIRFTGQQDGELSMQFFWHPDRGIEVCEIAARFLGYEHELIEFCSGLSIEELLLNSVYAPERIPLMLQEHNPFFDKSSAVLYFHGREREIASLESAEKCFRSPEISQSWIFYRQGEQVQEFARPYVARCFLHAGTREEIDRATDRIFAEMSIPDSSGEEILYRNVRTQYPDILTSHKEK